MINDKLKTLPKKPGCYLMKDINNTIIYVGKAKNLFNRVKSYFVGVHNAKTTKLVSQIVDFEYIITSSDKEAYILEMNLIKKHRPKYNIIMMDDKIYPYIVVTNEEHPRIFYTRDIKKKGHYYGPYPNASSARETVEMLNKIYPLRKCNKIPKKECLYYHIGQCLGPCINKVGQEEYNVIVEEISSLLRGNVSKEIKKLEKNMKEASSTLDFEKALEYRELIKVLTDTLEKQKMETSLKDCDIFNYTTDDSNLSIQIFHIRNQKMVERNGYLLDNESEEEQFIDFIRQFYLINNNPLPYEIIVPNIDISYLEDEIKQRVIIPKQGRKKELLDLVKENALEKLEVLKKEKIQQYEKTIGALNNISRILDIEYPKVIEAFDNSNIQGTSSVSAMVSYLDGVPDKTNYRKYNVKTIIGANDVATMKKVVNRRYKRLIDENQELPNLIVIDGGKTQVEAVLATLKHLQISINVLGLVKNDNHQTDHLYFKEKDIEINKRSKEFYLLESIQDEVHRYAISFHHQVHSKNLLASELDKIYGIGESKRKQILEIYGDIDFIEKLNNLKLTEKQKEAILKIYNFN